MGPAALLGGLFLRRTLRLGLLSRLAAQMEASLLFGRLLLCRAFRLGLLGRLCTLAAPLAPPGGLLGLLRRRRHGDRRRSKQLLQVGIGQHALGGAELPDQRLGQLLPAGAAQQEDSFSRKRV